MVGSAAAPSNDPKTSGEPNVGEIKRFQDPTRPVEYAMTSEAAKDFKNRSGVSASCGAYASVVSL